MNMVEKKEDSVTSVSLLKLFLLIRACIIYIIRKDCLESDYIDYGYINLEYYAAITKNKGELDVHHDLAR